MNPRERAHLCWLIDRVVDGEATPQEVRELERLAATSEGRRLYLEYLLMLGELHWGAFGASAEGKSAREASTFLPNHEGLVHDNPSIATLSPVRGRPESAHKRPLQWWMVPAAVALLVASVLVAPFLVGVFTRHPQRPAPAGESVVALCTGRFDAVFDPASAGAEGELRLGDRVVLHSGLAQWVDRRGGRWVLEGPATFRVVDSTELHLENGRLVVHLAPQEHEFTVDTPHARVLDRGTVFAVAVSPKETEIHVLSGRVAVKPHRFDKDFREILSGHAVAVLFGNELQEIAWAGDRFWAEVPPKGSVAAYRFAATHHPRMWFYLSFEEPQASVRRVSLGERYEVTPVMMRGTFSLLSPDAVSGYDGSSRAVRLIRGRSGGNAWGLGWQTENPVAFPRRFSFEMIFRFEGWPDPHPEAVGCLLAARQSARECGFLLAALPSPGGDGGQALLAHLLDATDNWATTQGRLVAGHWYYVATTLEGATSGEATHVVTYLLDLSTRESGLRRIFDGVIPGQVPPGRLGIGKGFDERLAHAYPFPGAIDEVCFYNDKVEDSTWQKHVALLVPSKEQAAPMPLPE